MGQKVGYVCAAVAACEQEAVVGLGQRRQATSRPPHLPGNGAGLMLLSYVFTDGYVES